MNLPFVPAQTVSTEGSIGIYPVQSSLQVSGQDKFQSRCIVLATSILNKHHETCGEGHEHSKDTGYICLGCHPRASLTSRGRARYSSVRDRMDKVQDIHHVGGDPADRIELVVNSLNSRVYGACSITDGPGDSINIGPA